MANDITGNPWILDTAATVVGSGTVVKILKMVFYAGTAGDDLDVQNGAGKSIWKVKAAAAATNYEDYAGVPFNIPDIFITDGLIVGTIDGGELWVWVK